MEAPLTPEQPTRKRNADPKETERKRAALHSVLDDVPRGRAPAVRSLERFEKEVCRVLLWFRERREELLAQPSFRSNGVVVNYELVFPGRLPSQRYHFVVEEALSRFLIEELRLQRVFVRHSHRVMAGFDDEGSRHMLSFQAFD